MTIEISGLPPLRWLVEPSSSSVRDDELRIDAGPRTDLFTDPAGSAPTHNSPVLLADVDGDFTLSCRVAPTFASTFDAGVLIAYGDDQTWAKLCFEYSPRHEPMVVSVVTRGVSDDSPTSSTAPSPAGQTRPALTEAIVSNDSALSCTTASLDARPALGGCRHG